MYHMTALSMFLTVVACKHCYSAKELPIVDPEGQAHPNQLLKVNLEQVKVHIILAAGKYNVDPNYSYSGYTSYWIFAKNNIDSLPYVNEVGNFVVYRGERVHNALDMYYTWHAYTLVFRSQRYMYR